VRVTIERSGGFAGIAMRREVDGASLDELEAATLERLVHDAVEVPQPLPRPMPDAFQYDVNIDGHARTLIETDLPPEWERLIEWVMRLAES
jgi:hypothetical protein